MRALLFPAVLASVVLLVGCSGGSEPAAPPPSRVQSVAVAPVKARPAEHPAAWCDVYADAESAEDAENIKAFSWPELDGQPAPTKGSGWTWVNAWATWCKPCIEEMPRLAKWEQQLQGEVGPGSVRYLSLDATAEVVAKFKAAKPELGAIAGDLRITDEAQMDPWVESLGLEPAAAALPVHVFLDAQEKVRCVYMGGISEGEYATIKGLLTSL